MIRDISKTLTRLQDESTPLSDALLYTLSDLDRSGRQTFQDVWPRLSTERRRQVLAAIVTMAEEKVDVDFNFILRLSLDDPDEEVRVQAVSGLWEDENPSLTGPLTRLLNEDTSELVRAEAAAALGQFVLMGEMGQLETNQAFAVQESLLRTYNNPTESIEVRRRALEALAYSSDEVIRDMIDAAYRDPEEKMVISALIAMGRSADSHWQRTILRELQSTNAEIRYEATRAAGALEFIEAVHPLGELAQSDSDQQVREMAIRALGEIGGKEARRVLENLEETEESEELQDVIAEALDELSFLEDALDVPPLYSIDGSEWSDDDESDEDSKDGDTSDY